MQGKRVLILLLAGLLAVTALGCGKQQKYDNIVFPYGEIREYIKKARAQQYDLDILYRDTVLAPVSEVLVALNMTEMNFLPTITNLDQLEKANNALAKENAEDIVAEALAEAGEYIPDKSFKVYLLPADPDDTGIKYLLNGVYGLANPPLGCAIVQVNPEAEQWKETLKYATASYYYRIVAGIEVEPTTLDVLLWHGKAESFARIVYPDADIPWTSGKIMSATLNQIKDDLLESAPNYYPWGSGEEETIGYSIVQEFIKNNPEVSFAEWSKMPAAELYEKSGYTWEIND